MVEGLFENDLSDPDLGVIPNLALNYGTWNGNKYTVELKPGILFHDGTPFNADAVKFSFDRLQFFIDMDMAASGIIYQYFDHETDELKPIINSVNVMGEYTVEFELDVPYGLFESILCTVGSSILSPSSTPEYDLIDTYGGDLVGTGPFTFEYFEPDVEVSFRAFDNYWKGKADIDHLVFKFYYNQYERAEALLNNEIHMIKSVPMDYIDLFEADPLFTVDSMDGASVFYVGMNNYWINKDLREAISYAIDYNYIIDELLGGRASRLRSPIPEGILYSDDSFIVAETDIIRARKVMQELGYGTSLNLYDDAPWEESNFMSFNFTYISGHFMSTNTFYLFQDNLGKIGIEVLDAGVDWWTFQEMLSDSSGYHREMSQLFWLGWGADYNDPSNFIDTLFTNRTVGANGVHYNGYQSAIEAGRDPFNLLDNVQLLMEEALFETDPLLREQYYQRIQQLLVEQDRPWVFGYVPLTSAVYNSEVQGFQWNSMSSYRFYGVIGFTHDVLDTTPPVTEIYLEGIMTWPWSGWYTSDVLVTLVATDYLSGVYMTGYSFNEVDWFLYTEPFWVNDSTTFYYGSVDYDGNSEYQSIEINIDKTPPETEISLSGIGINDWYVSDVIVTLTATDDDSGVLGIGYSFGGEQIIYTVPFLIEKTTTFGYGSVDFAGNYGAASMITIEIFRTPSVITDKIIEVLEDLDVPPSAQREVDKALVDLQAAVEKFNEEDFYCGIQRIFKTMKHLMDAANAGADVFSIGYVLVGMVMNMVDNAINDAIAMVGEDNKFVMKAQEFYNDALVKLSEGKFDQAINSFKHAYKFAMKAKVRGIQYQIWMNF